MVLARVQASVAMGNGASGTLTVRAVEQRCGGRRCWCSMGRWCVDVRVIGWLRTVGWCWQQWGMGRVVMMVVW